MCVFFVVLLLFFCCFFCFCFLFFFFFFVVVFLYECVEHFAPYKYTLLCYQKIIARIALFSVFFIFDPEFDLDLEVETIFNCIIKMREYVLFDVLQCIKRVQQIIYQTLMHLFLAAILDAILDFSARTNVGHCIPVV